MGVRVQVRLAHPGQQRAERRGPGDVGAQHQGVDEEAHEVVEGRVAPAGDRGAERDVVPGAQAAEQDREGGLERHEDGAARLPRQVAQHAVGLRVEGEVHGTGPVSGDGRALMVHGKLEFLGQPLQLPGPVVQFRVGRAAAVERPPLPQRVVGVLDGERWPGGAGAAQPGRVGRLQVAQQWLRRPAVGGDVVDEQQQDVLVGGEGVQRGPYGDLGIQREGVRGGLAEQRLDGPGPGRYDLDGHDGVRQDPLVGRAVVVRVDRAQRLVAGDDVVERRAQGGCVERSCEAYGGVDVVRRAGPLQPVQEPQPGLCGGQRHRVRARGRTQHWSWLGGRRLQEWCERGDGRRVEDRPQGDDGPEFGPDAGDQAGGQDGVAAEGEELVVDADRGQPEQVGEERAQGRLRLGTGDGGGGETGEVGGGQGRAVELAVGGERQVVEQDDGGGHQVLRERRPEVLPDPQRPQRGAGPGYGVGDQPRLARLVLTYRHCRLGHSGQRGHGGLRLARLHAESADLHLAVGPAEELQRPTLAPAHQVAGAVEAGAGRAVGVGDEAARGQAGAAEVAAGELGTAQVELAGYAGRHRAQVVVQDEGAGVPHRAADRYGTGGGPRPLGARPGGDVHGGLGGAVQVVQLGAGQQLGAVFGEFGGQGFSAAHQSADHAPRLSGTWVVEEDAQHRGDEVRGCDPAVADQPGEVAGVAVAAGAGEHEHGPGDQRPEELPDGHVESGRSLLQHPVVPAELVRLLHPQQPVDDPGVRDDGALGAARGAGGVDDVGRMLGAQRLKPVVVGEFGGVQGVHNTP